MPIRTVAPVITYEWRGSFASTEVNALHAKGFGQRRLDDDWRARVDQHSLGWVCARAGSELAGFVNLAWDGGRSRVHPPGTLVAARLRRQGVGAKLAALAVVQARAAGCGWLHVDFEDHLRPFYFGSCGFRPANAGLIAL